MIKNKKYFHFIRKQINNILLIANLIDKLLKTI